MRQGRDRGLGCPWLKCFTSAEHTATRRGAATPPGSGKGPPRGTRPGTPLCPAVLPLDGPPRIAGFGETEQNPSRPGCAWLPSLLPPQFLIVQKLQLTARWPHRRRVVSPVHQSCSINQSAHVRVTAVSGGPRLGTGWRSDPSPAPASECHACAQSFPSAGRLQPRPAGGLSAWFSVGATWLPGHTGSIWGRLGCHNWWAAQPVCYWVKAEGAVNHHSAQDALWQRTVIPKHRQGWAGTLEDADGAASQVHHGPTPRVPGWRRDGSWSLVRPFEAVSTRRSGGKQQNSADCDGRHGGLSDKRAWRFRGGGARCFANSPFPLETSLLVLLKHRLRHVSAEHSCFSLYSLGFRSRLQRASPMQVT